MDEFLMAWDNVASNYEGHHEMKPRVIRDLFCEQWKQSKVLKGDIDHYDRLPANSPEKTIEFMRSSMERHQNRNRQPVTARPNRKLTPKVATHPMSVYLLLGLLPMVVAVVVEVNRVAVEAVANVSVAKVHATVSHPRDERKVLLVVKTASTLVTRI